MIIQPSPEALEFLAHGHVTAWNGWIQQERQLHRDPKLVVDLRYRDLRGVRLCEADLAFADCRWTDFSDTDLSGALFCYAKLSEAVLARADCTETWFTGADLRRADAEEASFFGAKLIISRLQGIRLQGANLQNADLQGAEFAEVETEKAIGIAVVHIPGQAPLILTNQNGKIHVQPREGAPLSIAAYIRHCFRQDGAQAREVVPALTFLLQSKKGAVWAEALREANGTLRQQSVLKFLRAPTRIVRLIPQARWG